VIDIFEAVKPASRPGAAERVRAVSYMQDARLEMTLAEALDTMGSTPDEVAETLRGKGIRGSRGSSERCPVARYLAPIFDGYYVETYSTAVSMRLGDRLADVAAWVGMPVPVALFIDLFDNPDGPYTDLIEPASRPAVSIVDAP
jgi:hypothetical protein